MKILWAVDVFENHPKAIEKVARFLAALNARQKIKADAVTVIFPADARPTPKDKKKYSTMLKDLIGKKILNESWFNTGHVLFETQIPQRVAVMDILTLAENENYDAIVVVKHSRPGLKRHFIGSFAEMLAFLSPLPLFIVNPDGNVDDQLNNMLFASDGAPELSRNFKKLSQFMSLDGASFVLHSQIPLKYPGPRYAAAQKEFTERETKRIQKTFEAVRRVAGNLHVGVEESIKQEDTPTEDSILAAARKKKSSLIVLTHKRKGAIGFFLGRVTRRVLQESDRPVLLLRT